MHVSGHVRIKIVFIVLTSSTYGTYIGSNEAIYEQTYVDVRRSPFSAPREGIKLSEVRLQVLLHKT